MKKYLFLSSAFLMTMTSAFGADKIITSANTCTVDVLGVSDNNATANTIATWDLIDYTLDPGEYLNVTDTSVTETTCPAGSYCVGGGFTVETANNSIAQCPTTHPNSADGASADTQCYTACTVATANIAHATAVTGNDYYGSGVDTCTPTGCETGYHVQDGELVIIEKEPLIPVNYEILGNGNFAYIDSDGSSDFVGIPEDALDTNSTWVSEFDYGRVYGKASCQPAMNPAATVLFSEQTMTPEEYKAALEPIVGSVKASFAADLLSGQMDGSISELDGIKATYTVFMSEQNANYSTDSIGQYCYCQVDGFAPTGGEKQIVTSAPWILFGDRGSAGACASDCANFCIFYLQYDHVIATGYRSALFGALGYTESGGICAANTINIDWNPDNGGDHIKNMCTYDGAVTLPTPDPVKPGYTFTGWKLVE